jgi:hypothetical protein
MTATTRRRSGAPCIAPRRPARRVAEAHRCTLHAGLAQPSCCSTWHATTCQSVPLHSEHTPGFACPAVHATRCLKRSSTHASTCCASRSRASGSISAELTAPARPPHSKMLLRHACGMLVVATAARPAHVQQQPSLNNACPRRRAHMRLATCGRTAGRCAPCMPQTAASATACFRSLC